jgi:hypothetical protein
MTEAKKYKLIVKAGPDYKNQEDVHVNTDKATHISTSQIEARVHVRIKGFRGEYEVNEFYDLCHTNR